MSAVHADPTVPPANPTPAGAFNRGRSDLGARGEPMLWLMGGSLAIGVLMILGFLALILSAGVQTFWPKPLALVTLQDGTSLAGEAQRQQTYKATQPGTAQETALTAAEAAPRAAPRAAPAQPVGEGAVTPGVTAKGAELQGAPAVPAATSSAALAGEDKTEADPEKVEASYRDRTLYRAANYDLIGDREYQWVPDDQVREITYPGDLVYAERLENGPFIGRVVRLSLSGQAVEAAAATSQAIDRAIRAGAERRAAIYRLEAGEVAPLNRAINDLRLATRAAALKHGRDSVEAKQAAAHQAAETQTLLQRQSELLKQSAALKEEDARSTLTLVSVEGQEVTLPVSSIVRLYAPNQLDLGGKLAVYAGRWGEFLFDNPREANMEGGVWPAIVGTFVMTIVLSLLVAPFGIITALYLREYARQGPIVSTVRVAVNNLAGVPSIVYGVFGLGFFAYILGHSIDQLFYAERLPTPTFGTGGVLWSALTMALLTVPVVIVATEEAIAAVPRSMREGSLACGASKWQTIRRIVLPRAAPGIMTGLILAMARGAGEVAPLMIVGVVKIAPDLPIDGEFPYLHLDRSFMHLGFHIFDVGFQSRNSEAGKPMVFVTTMLLILIVLLLNYGAISLRTRLKRRFKGSQF